MIEKKLYERKEGGFILDRAGYYGFWIIGGLLVCLVTWSWWPLIAVLISCLACELVLNSL
jgi:hypothetical protein